MAKADTDARTIRRYRLESELESKWRDIGSELWRQQGDPLARRCEGGVGKGSSD
jgi:hypothetical protein